jgi:hypothetical protein
LIVVLCCVLLWFFFSYARGAARKTLVGTTYSCVAVFKEGNIEIVANDLGERTTPSWVAFTDTERLIGQAAKNQVGKNPKNTLYDIKRLIGSNTPYFYHRIAVTFLFARPRVRRR